MEEINSRQEYDLNCSMRSATHVELGTRLKYLQVQDGYHYSGVRQSPSYTISGSTIDVGEGTYALYPDSSGSSLIQFFTISGGIFELQDSITTYIYCYYDSSSGSAIVSATTDRNLVTDTNLTNAIPIFTCYNYQGIINVINWQDQGLALAEKELLRFIDTDRFHRTSGLQVGEYGTMNVSITSGSLYYGANQMAIRDFASASPLNYMYLISRDISGVWSGSLVTQYNNNNYQSSTGLSVLTNSQRYAVNWIYRIVSDNKRFVGIVLGTGDYKLDEALASMPPPSLPNVIMTQGILCARIIVQKGASIATEIDSAFDIGFSPTSLDHNSLFNLQGGITDEYYHLTAQQYGVSASLASGSITSTHITSSSFTGTVISASAKFGTENDYTYFESDGTMVMSGSAIIWDDMLFPLVTAKQGQTDKPAFDTNEVAYLFPSNDTSASMLIVAQFPHSYKQGTNVDPHVHWKQTQSGSPVFKMAYKWFGIGAQIPETWAIHTMDQRVAPFTSGSLHQLNYGSNMISASMMAADGYGVSSIMLIKLYRDDNAYIGNAVTYQFDIHFQKDTIGSRSEYSK